MTAQKHTPWMVGIHPWPEQIGCCPLVGRPYSVHGADNRNVAAATTPEIARLIAASPDMLEALYEAEEYFDNRADADHDETGFVPNEEMKLLTVVRAAIAKATGQ